MADGAESFAAWKVVLIVLVALGGAHLLRDAQAPGAPEEAGEAAAATTVAERPAEKRSGEPPVLAYPAHIQHETMPRATEKRIYEVVEAAEAGRRADRDLVIVVGDSRFRAAFAPVLGDTPTGFHLDMALGSATADVLILTEAATRAFRRIDPLMTRLLAMKPARFVTQPTMFVPNGRYLLAGKRRLHRRGQGDRRGRIVAQWSEETLPEPGPDLELGAYWAQELRQAGVEVVVIELAPSELVFTHAPRGYFEAREKLVLSVLYGPSDRYMRLVEWLPDDHYRDFNHFNDIGRERVRDWVLAVTGGSR